MCQFNAKGFVIFSVLFAGATVCSTLSGSEMMSSPLS
jgi:hypothetical protein